MPPEYPSALLSRLEEAAVAWLRENAELNRKALGPAGLGPVKQLLVELLGHDYADPGRFHVLRSPRVLIVAVSPVEPDTHAELHILPASEIKNADDFGLDPIGEELRVFWRGYLSINARMPLSRSPHVPSVIQLRRAIADAVGYPLAKPYAFTTDQLFAFASPVADPQRMMRLVVIPHVSVALLAPFPPSIPSEILTSNEVATHPSR